MVRVKGRGATEGDTWYQEGGMREEGKKGEGGVQRAEC
jgi:hypothetical protein